ncbi:MAG TPA: SH3 domain-containing protein [Terriglobales bacterium]|nr:SH3 domain-containing protein [Terriglobales bacterium]
MKTLSSSAAGRLPVLDGFTIPGERPLDRFQRGYYQCTVQITALPSGGTRVQVNAKITAWYADPVSSHSGYQTLPSNGRIESDLLDQISDALGASPAMVAPTPNTAEPAISAPMPRIPESALHASAIALPDTNAGSLQTQTDVLEKHEQELAEEAKSLEEILQNQAHPNNLAAVKKTGTPILQSPNADARILFPATAGDEFEILDVNSNWVHVRISGLSRGWIRRSALEMPEDFSGAKQVGSAAQNTVEEFRISNEQIAPFPGDWDSLRGKIVKIVTVQKASQSGTASGSQGRLQFAKALFMEQYSKIAATDAPAGIVVIFDSDDGGMIAATLETLKEWQAGSASDDSIWRQCFFDPPELSGK